MKKLTQRLTAVSAAILMATSVFAMPVLAKEPAVQERIITEDCEDVTVESDAAVADNVKKLINYIKANGSNYNSESYSIFEYADASSNKRFYASYSTSDNDIYFSYDEGSVGSYFFLKADGSIYGNRAYFASSANNVSDYWTATGFSGSTYSQSTTLNFTITTNKGAGGGSSARANELLKYNMVYVSKLCNKAGLKLSDIGFTAYGSVAGTPGWNSDSKGYYYVKSDGKCAVGWLKVGTLYYYFDSNGYMVKGWKQINNQWFYFSPTNGNMWTGWHQIGTKWYLFDKTNGNMKTGWIESKGLYYYLTGDGMATGWLTIGTNKYYFSKNGIMFTGWHKIGSYWYYFEKKAGKTQGQMYVNRWKDNCWLKSNGRMATSAWVDGGKYYVGKDGKWVPNKKK